MLLVFRAGFCSKTIIPDSQEHLFALSGGLSHALVRWIGLKDSTAYQEDPSTWKRHWELVYQRQLGQDDEDTENREALDQYLKQNPEADSRTILQQALVTGNLRAAFPAAKADAESRGEEWNHVYVGPEERAIEADYQAFLANLAAEDKETWTAHADNIAQIAAQDPATAYLIKKRFRLLSAYGLSSRSHTIRYKQTEPFSFSELPKGRGVGMNVSAKDMRSAQDEQDVISFDMDSLEEERMPRPSRISTRLWRTTNPC